MIPGSLDPFISSFELSRVVSLPSFKVEEKTSAIGRTTLLAPHQACSATSLRSVQDTPPIQRKRKPDLLEHSDPKSARVEPSATSTDEDDVDVEPSATSTDEDDVDVEASFRTLGIAFRHQGDKKTPIVEVKKIGKKICLSSKNRFLLLETIEALRQWKSLAEKSRYNPTRTLLKQDDDDFFIPIEEFLPSMCAEAIGRFSSGANCFGTALGSLGLTASFQHVPAVALEFYLAKCFDLVEPGRPPMPGDIGVIGEEGYGFNHAFIYINDQVIFHKSASDLRCPWSLESPEDLVDTHLIGQDDSIITRFFRLKEHAPLPRFSPLYQPVEKDEEPRLFAFHLESLDSCIKELYPLRESPQPSDEKKMETAFLNLVEYFDLILCDIRDGKITDPDKIKTVLLRFSAVLYDHHSMLETTKIFMHEFLTEEERLPYKKHKKVKIAFGIDSGIKQIFFERARLLYKKLCSSYELALWIPPFSPEEEEECEKQITLLRGERASEHLQSLFS